MAVRGRGSLKLLQDTATLSKEELSKMEKDAERRTADRKKLKESGKKAPSGTRRAKVQARRAATNSIPKAVRDKMISPAQDAQNKKDEKLRTQNRRGPSKKGVEKAMKALLVYNDIEPPITHSFAVLIRELRKTLEVPESIQRVIELEDYAVQTRYPGDYTPVDETEYHRHVLRICRSHPHVNHNRL